MTWFLSWQNHKSSTLSLERKFKHVRQFKNNKIIVNNLNCLCTTGVISEANCLTNATLFQFDELICGPNFCQVTLHCETIKGPQYHFDWHFRCWLVDPFCLNSSVRKHLFILLFVFRVKKKKKNNENFNRKIYYLIEMSIEHYH